MLKMIGLCSILALGSSLAGAQTPDSVWAGTWTLNVAKSKLHPPAAKSETVTIPAPGWSARTVKYTFAVIAGDGSALNGSFDGAADGKPYSAMASGKELAKGVWQRQSSHHYNSTFTFPDGSKDSQTIVIAPSGKTMTIQTHATASTGNYDETAIFEKQ